MNLIEYKTIAALLIFIVSIATVIYPLKKKGFKHTESIQLGEALASGIFLGAAFFHMLPDAIRTFEDLYPSIKYPTAEILCISGFLLLVFLERISLINTSFKTEHSIPYILGVILIIHAFIEGAALGMGSTYPETVLFFIAIIAHKGSESFALCITMLRHQLPIIRILPIIIFFAVMTPIGIFTGVLISEFAIGKTGQLAAAVFNAFAAGTFLYMSTMHHIHFHQHIEDAQGLLEFASLVLGVTMMGLIALWA